MIVTSLHKLNMSNYLLLNFVETSYIISPYFKFFPS